MNEGVDSVGSVVGAADAISETKSAGKLTKAEADVNFMALLNGDKATPAATATPAGGQPGGSLIPTDSNGNIFDVELVKADIIRNPGEVLNAPAELQAMLNPEGNIGSVRGAMKFSAELLAPDDSVVSDVKPFDFNPGSVKNYLGRNV